MIKTAGRDWRRLNDLLGTLTNLTGCRLLNDSDDDELLLLLSTNSLLTVRFVACRVGVGAVTTIDDDDDEFVDEAESLLEYVVAFSLTKISIVVDAPDASKLVEFDVELTAGLDDDS